MDKILSVILLFKKPTDNNLSLQILEIEIKLSFNRIYLDLNHYEYVHLQDYDYFF